MKRIALVSMVLFAGLAGGCAIDFSLPAHTAKERFEMMAYDQDFQAKLCNDDIDHMLLLRPISMITQWNLFHRD